MAHMFQAFVLLAFSAFPQKWISLASGRGRGAVILLKQETDVTLLHRFNLKNFSTHS
jgi:hypothetical protein